MNRKNIWIGVGLVVVVLATSLILNQRNRSKDAEEDTVSFTAVLPLTGHLAHLGENERIGMTLALQDAEKNGNARISFSYHDSAGKGATAATIVQKELNVSGSRFFIVATTGPILATMPIFQDFNEGKAVIAQTMYPGITRDAPFAFQLFPSSRQEAILLAQHALATGKKRVAALHIQNEWGTQSVNTFGQALEEGGGTLVASEVFTFADKDFRSILTKLLTAEPDALLIYAYPVNFPTILKQFAEIGRPIPVLANADFAIGNIAHEVPAEILADTVFPAPKYLFEAINPDIQEFNAHMRESGHEPNFDIATFYDMTMILNEAANRAQDGTPQAFLTALESVFPYDGVTGHMSLNKDRSLEVDFTLSRWVDGGLQPLQ